MSRGNALRAAVVAALLAAAPAAPAAAAEGSDNCGHVIETLPATIDAPGVWCLRANLALDQDSAPAITIAANHATLDCNGHSLTLAAGNTNPYGVMGANVQATTIRHCRIFDFQIGIALADGAGHLVEDNLVRGARVDGIKVLGPRSLVRRNRVLDTGGTAVGAIAIQADGDILDNVIDGVRGSGDTPRPVGIDARGEGAEVRGNVVRDVGGYIAIHLSKMAVATGNQLHVPAGGGHGITGNVVRYCVDNSAHGFATPFNCTVGSGNTTH